MLSALLTAAVFLAAQPAPPYRNFVLETSLKVWDVDVSDMNGDGMADILLLTCDEQSYPLKKELALFLSDGKGGYPSKPSAVLPLDPSMGAAMLAECDGKPPKELVVLDAAGALVYHFEAGKFEKIGEPRFFSLLPSHAKEPSFLKHSAKDLLSDGRDVWFIPTPSGYDLRRMDGSVALASCDVVSEMRREENTYIVHRLPAVHPFDVPGEKTKGLAFLSDEFADFAHGPDWTQHERFRIPINLEEKWQGAAHMEDFNNDGLPDLVVTQMKGTINMMAQTQIYIAKEPFKYPAKPTKTFSTKGGVSSPILIDVDGDKRKDVVLISIPFGITNFVNFFVRGKIAIHADVYLFNGTDFGDKPTFSTGLTMDAPEGRERVAYTFGDFNGDGRLDVAFGKESDTLAIRTGEKERFLSSDPWVTIKVPSFGMAEAYDLNGNAAQDIVMYHPGGPNAKRVDVIVF
jgi:hypothetical protein